MSTKFPDRILCNNEYFSVYIPREEIDVRITSMGAQISKEYADKRPILIGVLNGAYIFLADLMRSITIPCEVDFLKLSSYGDEKVSSGKVTQLKELDANVEGRHIILVEDIIDTGLSMKYIVDKIKSGNPASVKIVTLLHKKEATKHAVDIDYVGFEIPTLFVLGYGMDYAQEGRNLPHIYVIEDDNKK